MGERKRERNAGNIESKYERKHEKENVADDAMERVTVRRLYWGAFCLALKSFEEVLVKRLRKIFKEACADVKQMLDDGVAWGLNAASCEELMPDRAFGGRMLTEQDGYRYEVRGKPICALGFRTQSSAFLLGSACLGFVLFGVCLENV